MARIDQYIFCCAYILASTMVNVSKKKPLFTLIKGKKYVPGCFLICILDTTLSKLELHWNQHR